ncbi:MAG: hypothetical protein GQF41_1723 [Candidatus Rifleibacterium amylolyticum]|nr:MAG: hypothetical protein GQF41_1723 [Candidatus Rifleibacterium amylolyticum]
MTNKKPGSNIVIPVVAGFTPHRELLAVVQNAGKKMAVVILSGD